MFELAKGMPQLHTSQLPWINDSVPEGRHIIFDMVTRPEQQAQRPCRDDGGQFLPRG
jgi:hypothetical protein